ncbi:hypothetical protein ACFPM3_22600 [Streptomyces coeruleoprunus]|uniref:DUF11 domain-containing protein n=1 Tax=Streptomyces coeruleoprunus TaxID=285563 RepID=A0ABV9XHQ5_9ACTN
MRSSSVARALSRGACVTVAAGLATVGLAGPAVADSDQLWLTTPYEVTLPVATEGGEAPAQTLKLGLSHDNTNYTVTDGHITVDVSGLAGVAEVTWPEGCAPSGATAVCSVPEVPVSGTFAGVRLDVRAVPGAAVGATGRIGYTARATTTAPGGELTAFAQETTVTLASGPDLVLRATAPSGDVQPGATVAVPFTVVNRGNEPSRGVRVSMYVTRGLDVGAVAPQCTTTPLGGEDGYIPVSKVECAFGDVLAPGASFALPEPLRATVAPYAFHERVDLGVEPGDGATDLSPSDNGESVGVRAVNTADFQVKGAEVTGAAGETVTAALTFRNKGPAWVANLGSGEPVGVLDFVVPRGATVVEVPENCSGRTLDGDWYEEPTGAPRYQCRLPLWVGEKQTVTFPLKLRVDTVVPDATGTLRLLPGWGEARPVDPDTRNNEAKVVLNPAG